MSKTRLSVIKVIMSQVTDELVITTTGYLSRDVYSICDRPENFYMCGSMGNAFGIGLGIALHSNRKVIVISGDGAALMSLNALVLGNYLNLDNITHHIMDNKQYKSTGGQPTCSSAIDFTQFSNTIVHDINDIEESSPRIDLTPTEILQRFMAVIHK
jgi:phosphonopyruvate decarboxylase